ncbi:MAG TPA: hypothetical protein VGL81_16585 [Polyangiaceae bacterium]|jgi:hypothetical protein
MVAPHEAEINLDAYARLTVALSRAGEKREAVLTAHGLDEDRWQAIDGLWQARLSDAMEQGTDEQPIPPFLQEFSRAIDRAQSDDSGVIALERFAEATRAVSQTGDVVKALERLGLTIDEYMHANHYWVQRMAKDDDLAETFRRAVG